MGEAVKAVVELAAGVVGGSGAREAELIDYCQSQLATYKCPRTVDFVDASCPETRTASSTRRLLKEQYWEGHDTRVL